ncbi:MAG: helix-turn-helix transcriptional regulator [Clostridia bacterium]|nr:helix-turn-helix transcriptional regulator [Clostridia bacterium]
MASKVGKLIKEARTGADLTQEKLAKKVGGGLTANDISLAERGEKELSQAQLKKIAKACGVTQASLLNAAKGTTTKKTTTAKKTTTTKKTTTAKKTTTTEKKPKTPANANTSMKVTTTEKKLIEYYRLADSDTKKAATKVLKGECGEFITNLLGGGAGASDGLSDVIGDVLENLFGQ